jgi:hypothetical protein
VQIILSGWLAGNYPVSTLGLVCEVGLWGVITAPCRKFWEDYGLTGIS